MSQAIGVLDITFKAGEILTGKKYYFVKLDANGDVVVCGNNEVSIGILQNEPDTVGKAARVRVLGTSKLVMDAGVDEGIPIMSIAGGAGTPVTGDQDFAGAIDLEAATAQNDIVEVLLTHMYYAVTS